MTRLLLLALVLSFESVVPAEAGRFGPSRSTLQEQLEELESRIAELEAANWPPAASGAHAAETEAAAIYREAQQHYDAQRYSDALQQLERLEADFPSSDAMRAASRMLSELRVIGATIPLYWRANVEHWFQGEGTINLQNGTVLIVFWEKWCPHCVREVPELQKTVDRLGGEGLEVVGLTKLTRNVTLDAVETFLSEQSIDFPVAKEDGRLSQAFSVSGIPAAVVLVDGMAVWRGHPARLSDSMLRSWL